MNGKDFDESISPLTNAAVLSDNGNAYIPEFGFNGIGDWELIEGYQYKMTAENVLTLRGSRVIPELNPLTFTEGWNMMAYLRNTPADIIPVMSDVVEAIAIIKDEVIECDSKKNLTICDLTGAGDLFAAGFLHGQINNLSTRESLEKGTEMSSQIIQKIGARLN
jgi:hypothetical protein